MILWCNIRFYDILYSEGGEVMYTNKTKTVCFTGHREIITNYNDLYDTLHKILEELIFKGFLYFGAGGARGFDSIAAKVVLHLKEKHPQIHLILVLPFVNQYEHEKGWRKEDIEQYHTLKQKASKVVYLQDVYSQGCYYRRNRHLVDFSSVCVCYQNRYTGGTAYTVEYAKKKGLNIIRCNKKR